LSRKFYYYSKNYFLTTISDNIITLKSTNFVISESGFEYSIYRLSIQFGLHKGFVMKPLKIWKLANYPESAMKCYNKRKDSTSCFYNEPNSTKNFEIVEKIGEEDVQVWNLIKRKILQTSAKNWGFLVRPPSHIEKIRSGGSVICNESDEKFVLFQAW